MAPLIQVNQLGKMYRTGEVETLALCDINFEIKRGEFVAIIGPSGSGKSTLMHILGALDKQTTGSYWLAGKDVSKLNDDEQSEMRNQTIGFVFQAFNLLPRATTVKNVMLPMVYAGVTKTERIKRASLLLEKVGLGHRLTHLSNQLSGGQQQRVAIARALVMNPALLLADEPTGNIATSQAEEIMNLFHSLHRQGHTIIIITHEPDIAAHAQRIITIRDGQVASDVITGKKHLIKK